jgi:AcrR family transcriptional regulator
MPSNKATPTRSAPTESVRQRRPRGEPRRLLVVAAQDVFNRKGYASASTREIADTAQVSETLMFRYFGSKAGLFREAMVQPFVELVDREIEIRLANPNRFDEPLEESRKFIADMYDVFRKHRALAALLFAADASTESELAESGVLDEFCPPNVWSSPAPRRPGPQQPAAYDQHAQPSHDRRHGDVRHVVLRQAAAADVILTSDRVGAGANMPGVQHRKDAKWRNAR